MSIKLKNLPPVDLYALLCTDRESSKQEIVHAYRRIAMRCHPDTNHGDKKKAEIFKLATLAYEILTDAKKRAVYDRMTRPSLASRIIPWLGKNKSQAVRA